MSVERLPSSSHECYILTGTAVHHSMLYQLCMQCVIKVLMRLLPAATMHTSQLQETTGEQDARLTHGTSGGEIRWLPITADTSITCSLCKKWTFMYLLQLTRYADPVHMAICAHHYYICDEQSLRFQSLLEHWYFVNITNLGI